MGENMRTIVLSFLGLVFLVWACTPADRKAAGVEAQVAKEVCQGGFLLVGDPDLAPLCATITEVESVIAQLVAEHQATASPDAGPTTAEQWQPTAKQVHQRLAQLRGAK